MFVLVLSQKLNLPPHPPYYDSLLTRPLTPNGSTLSNPLTFPNFLLLPPQKNQTHTHSISSLRASQRLCRFQSLGVSPHAQRRGVWVEPFEESHGPKTLSRSSKALKDANLLPPRTTKPCLSCSPHSRPNRPEGVRCLCSVPARAGSDSRLGVCWRQNVAEKLCGGD